LQYIDRVVPAFRPMALAFGSAFHEAVQHHLVYSTPAEPVATDELHQIFRTSVQAASEAEPPLLLEEEDQDIGAVIDVGVRMIDTFVKTVPLPERGRT
jgi:hypothetical protein